MYHVIDDEAAFIRAICDCPEDDVTRLVFADWLQEHERDDQAEFIRAQIELTEPRDNDPRQPYLRGRVYQLLSEHRSEWLDHLPEWARKRAVFERGFVASVEGYCEDWLSDGSLLLERAPIRGVCLHNVRSRWRSLLADSNLSRLRTLDLRFERLGDVATADLASSFSLCELTTLHLWNNQIGDVGAQALAESPLLRGLQVLSLGGNEIGDAGARALASSPYLDELEQLVLFDNRIGPVGRAALRERFSSRVGLEIEE